MLRVAYKSSFFFWCVLMIKDGGKRVLFSLRMKGGFCRHRSLITASVLVHACMWASFHTCRASRSEDSKHLLIRPTSPDLKAWSFLNSCSLCVCFWPLLVCCSCHLCCSRLSVVCDNGAQIKNAHMHSRFQKPSISTSAESAAKTASEMTAVYICITSRRCEAVSLRPCVCSCHSL